MTQSTLAQIIESESQAHSKASKEYGEYFKHAIDSYDFLQKFVDKVDSKGWLFIAFVANVRKHHLLALLSTIRLHHVQAFMNLRQVLESGVNAAYAIANPNPDKFVIKTQENLLVAPKNMQNKRYKWLKNNYPNSSNQIRNLKNILQNSSHSNLVDVYRTFKFKTNKGNSELLTPFFDQENPFQVKSDLWVVANVVIGLTDIFYGVNKDHPVIAFTPNFVDKLESFERENLRLKNEMMNTNQYKRADRKARIRDLGIETEKEE